MRAGAMQRLIKQEQFKRLRRIAYQKNPLLWLEECMGEPRTNFEWSAIDKAYKNHKWDGDTDPLAKAWFDLAEHKWVGVEAATGTSKTYWLSRVVLWYLDCYEDSLVVTTAPKKDQLTLNLWAEMTKCFNKFKGLRPDSEMLNLKLRVNKLKRGSSVLNANDDTDLSQSWQAVGFITGSGNDEESATKAQGFHRENMLIILEETPGISKPVITAFQNTCTGSKNMILAVGNPDHQLDTLHQFCQQENVSNYRISALDYPNVVLDKEIFPGAVSNKSILRRENVYGIKSKMYLSRVRGLSPSQGADSLIRYDWIAQCCIFKPEYEEAGEVEVDDFSFNAVGVDVANSEEGDKAAVAWGQNNKLVSIQEFQCPDTNHLAYNIIYDDMKLSSMGVPSFNLPTVNGMNILAKHIGVDAVGVGAGTVNTLKMENYNCTSLQGGMKKEAIPKDDEGQPMYSFSSLRSQMYFTLSLELRAREIIIMISDQHMLSNLIREAVTPKLKVSGQKVAVESKEEIKKRLGNSPNILDAMVYWNWMRKNRTGTYGGLPFGS